MRICNAKVFLNGNFIHGGIEFDEKITAVGESVSGSGVFVNANGYFLIPGLIDIHSHGAIGYDVSDGDSCDLELLAAYYANAGVTSWCPTTMTLKEEDLISAVKHISEYKRPVNCSKIAGIHLEGPFLSSEKIGAQNSANLLKPDFDVFERIYSAANSHISIISVAPETEGALDFISKASKLTNVSLAHTAADYDTAMKAFNAGANHVTHLFNAMPALHHRMPGVAAASADSGAYTELICDGLHIHPAVIRLCFKLFGEKLCLISDSIRCCGLKDGEYNLGGLEVCLSEGKVCLKGTDTLAGSSINLMEGLRRCVAFGIPLEKAVYASTAAPSKAIGKYNEIGSLDVGKYADFVLLDEALSVKAVYISGHRVQ